MTQENIGSPELQQAESNFDNVLSSLKELKNETAERKTLTLPKKEESKKQELEESSEEQSNEPEVQQEEREITEDDFDPKTFVEVDSPQIQKKINYLYKQVKNKDEQAALLKDELRKLAENLEQKHQNELYLANELNNIKNKFTQEDETKVLSELRNQYKEAIDNYDYETATKINEKIIDFKTEQKLNNIINTKLNKEQIVERQPKAASYQPDPQDVRDLEKFSSEKSDNGSPLRPWLNQQHPEFQDVVDLTAALANKYIRKGQRPSLSTLMKEIDSIKGVRAASNSIKQPTTPAVLSGQSSVGFPTDNQVKLTNLERTFAAKMGVDEELYAKVKKLSSSGPISIESLSRKK